MNVAMVDRLIDDVDPLDAVNIIISTTVCRHPAACCPPEAAKRGLTPCNVMRTVTRP
nr:hypothetical protein [uncultured Cardiobacterium sp.]